MQKETETLKLTVSEAIAEGYIFFGYETDGFGTIHRIEKMNEADFEIGPLFLAEKESYYSPSISAESISELLAEQLWSSAGDETGDDTDDVYDIVKALDFTAVAEMINASLAHKKYYKLTKIQLIRDAKGNDTANDRRNE